MRKINIMGMVAVLMLLGGAATFLTQDNFLPLWVTWIVGPLLWYLGFAVALVWGYRFFFYEPEPESESEPETEVGTTKQTVVVMQRDPVKTRFDRAPAGVLHEIPAMGGFIL